MGLLFSVNVLDYRKISMISLTVMLKGEKFIEIDKSLVEVSSEF